MASTADALPSLCNFFARKIRHYGLMSAAHAKTRLELARDRLQPAAEAETDAPLIEAATPMETLATAKWREVIEVLTGLDLRRADFSSAHFVTASPRATLRWFWTSKLHVL